MSDSARQRVRELASEHSDHTAWFDQLYREAARDSSRVPWADRRPNKLLVEYVERESLHGNGRSCCVVGCGLGDDAELLDRRGFEVTAFDVSAEAIAWAKERFPSTRVNYVTADLFTFDSTFDFVFESYTVQALPITLRERSIERVAGLVATGGTLLLLARGRDANDEERPGPPWPLTLDDLRRFEMHGLACGSFEDLVDDEDVRRFRAVFGRG